VIWVAVGDHEITKRQRYREIVAVLARHGFGVVDDRMLKRETKEQARAEHLRLACEELGTLFIKLGQALSTRAGILPPAYRTELAKMQDDVPPLPTELIAEVIEEDLRARPAAIFLRLTRPCQAQSFPAAPRSPASDRRHDPPRGTIYVDSGQGLSPGQTQNPGPAVAGISLHLPVVRAGGGSDPRVFAQRGYPLGMRWPVI
jgi:hypothetical protein